MIRDYREDDAYSLVNIWLQASLQAHSFVDENYWRSKTDEMRNVWLTVAQTRVWEENGFCAGFVSLIDGEYVGALFVDPTFQNGGVGSQLLSSLQADYPRLQLKVFVKNESAVRFYQRHGFSIESQQTNIETGEEELLMCWEISEKD